MGSAKILAKELIRSRKARERLYKRYEREREREREKERERERERVDSLTDCPFLDPSSVWYVVAKHRYMGSRCS